MGQFPYGPRLLTDWILIIWYFWLPENSNKKPEYWVYAKIHSKTHLNDMRLEVRTYYFLRILFTTVQVASSMFNLLLAGSNNITSHSLNFWSKLGIPKMLHVIVRLRVITYVKSFSWTRSIVFHWKLLRFARSD